MPVGLQLVSSARVNAIVQGLQDSRQLDQGLVYLNRTRLVDAIDGEIMGRFIGQIVIADLIADDQKAVVRESGRISPESTSVPNLKTGVAMTQSMLNMLDAINAGNIRDEGIFSDYSNRVMQGILTSIRQRMEALIVAMHLDTFSYDGLGIKISDASWGMPTELKAVTAIAWAANPTTAKPITELGKLRRIGRVKYNQDYNRATMSSAAFEAMIATTEFKDRAQFILNAGESVSALPMQDTAYMRNLVGRVVGMEIELYDARYWYAKPDGTKASAPYQPINEIVLTNTANDNNPMVTDFANGIVTESIVSSMMTTSAVGGFPQPQRGPVGYTTCPPDLNPPNITMWGVARGFPRKHLLQANAVLNIGALEDDIPVGISI